MSEELNNLKSNEDEATTLRRLTKKFYYQELYKNLRNAFIRWIAGVIFTPIVVGFLTILGKVCWYIIQWAWHLF